MMSQAATLTAGVHGFETRTGLFPAVTAWAGSLAGNAPAASLRSFPSSVVIPMDYAQLRRDVETLRQQQRDQAETMLMLIHELRSPVVASKALAASLQYVNNQNAEVTGVLGRIEGRMDQLLALVNDILELTQVKAGHPLGDERVLDLVPETEAVCQPHLDQARLKGLTMMLDLPETPVCVRLAPRVYYLILSNLVSNAVKYTSAGSVQLRLEQQGSWVVLRVTDTGIGIPADEIPRLSTEFFRASNARRSRIPGTGLGLAGVKALVEQCGGELLVKSQEDQGSSFTVRLPAESSHNPRR